MPQSLSRHLRITTASPWVARFAPLVREKGLVLDLACGGGRHTRLFLEQGCSVVALDKNVSALGALKDNSASNIIEADLEVENSPFLGDGPLAGKKFDGIVVCNYLHRPLLDDIIKALAKGGVFIYETFARGNERFTKPRNPDHLLCSGELLERVREKLQVVAYEHGIVEKGPLPGVVQRICAVNDLGQSQRQDKEPSPHLIVPA
jgi:SAM-dependent methyltransferase